MPETATRQEYRELMKLLNNVFFHSVPCIPRLNFYQLLPKLYKEEYKPWEHNYVVRENSKLKAAVGMYISESSVAGETLRCGGIGNVAVARDCRGKGYMKQAMNAAMEAIAAAGCDFAELGGKRQRYQYWGFERAGAQVRVQFTKDSIRHTFGKIDMSGIQASRVQPADLPELQALIERAPLHVKYDPAAFGDVLRSWACRPYIIRQGGSIVAYFALKPFKFDIADLHVFQPQALPAAAQAIFTLLPKQRSSFEASIPLWESALLAQAEQAAEWLRLEDAGHYAVLNWERTLRALLTLQCQLKPLPDGELTVKIKGMRAEETLRLCVKDQQSTVEEYHGEAEMILEHLEAVRYFLSPVCTLRPAASWFPLPLFLYGMDKV